MHIFLQIETKRGTSVFSIEAWDHYFTAGGTHGLTLGDMRKLPGSGGEMRFITVPHPQREIYGEMFTFTQCLSPSKQTIFAGGILAGDTEAGCLMRVKT